MSGPGADGPFEVVVEPHNDHYHPDDDGWRSQVATLYSDLDGQVDTVRRGRAVEGAKGAVDQLVIALGSAGVFGAVVDGFEKCVFSLGPIGPDASNLTVSTDGAHGTRILQACQRVFCRCEVQRLELGVLSLNHPPQPGVRRAESGDLIRIRRDIRHEP